MKKDDELWACDKYDRKRVNTLTILRVMTASCFLGALLSAFGAYGIMIILLWIGIIFLVYSISFARIRSYIHEGRCLWRGTDRGVTMVVPREIIVWELVPWGLMMLGLPGASLVHALGAPAVAGGAVGGAGICGSVYLVLMFREGGRRLSVSSLTARGSVLPGSMASRCPLTGPRSRSSREAEGRPFLSGQATYMRVGSSLWPTCRCRAVRSSVWWMPSRPVPRGSGDVGLTGRTLFGRSWTFWSPPRRSTPTPPGPGRVLRSRRVVREVEAWVMPGLTRGRQARPSESGRQEEEVMPGLTWPGGPGASFGEHWKVVQPHCCGVLEEF